MQSGNIFYFIVLYFKRGEAVQTWDPDGTAGDQRAEEEAAVEAGGDQVHWVNIWIISYDKIRVLNGVKLR
jgi:hypothetical protein